MLQKKTKPTQTIAKASSESPSVFVPTRYKVMRIRPTLRDQAVKWSPPTVDDN